VAGIVRGAEEMEGGTEDVPPAKRQRVAKLPGGQLYPEQDWINMHPVRCLFFWSIVVLTTTAHLCFHLDIVLISRDCCIPFSLEQQHPISLQVKLPTDPSRPELKLDGTVVIIGDLSSTTLVTTLRDRILKSTGSAVSASKIRLSHAGKMLTNMSSIASYNLEDEDMLLLSVRDQRK